MNDESYRGKRASQFSRWLKTAQWRRVIGHLQVIAKMTSSSCQADLGWDCSNCYRFTSFLNRFNPQFQNMSTQLWFILSDHYIPNQSLLVTSHVGEKSYDWSDSVQVRDVKKRSKQCFEGEPSRLYLESISLVAEEATIWEYCGWYVTNGIFPYFTSLFKRNQTTKTFEVVK